MSDSKAVQLFERLHDKTMAGELDWQAAGDNGGFTFSTENYSLKIEKVYNDEIGDNDYKIKISDVLGRIVEEFWDISILDQVGDVNRPKYYKMYNELYECARRKALGADKAVDEIMNFLR